MPLESATRLSRASGHLPSPSLALGTWVLGTQRWQASALTFPLVQWLREEAAPEQQAEKLWSGGEGRSDVPGPQRPRETSRGTLRGCQEVTLGVDSEGVSGAFLGRV